MFLQEKIKLIRIEMLTSKFSRKF